MKRKASLVLFSVLMSGCAGVNHVVSTGGDSYMVAAHGVMGWSSGAAQKAKAFEQAASFCEKEGKELQAVSDNETQGGFGKIASSEVHFRCVKHNPG